MNFIPLDDCQLETETINPIAERFHRILLALVFTAILYVNVDMVDRSRVNQTVLPSNPPPILTIPIAEVALSDRSSSPSQDLLNPSECQTEKLDRLSVACGTQPDNRPKFFMGL